MEKKIYFLALNVLRSSSNPKYFLWALASVDTLKYILWIKENVFHCMVSGQAVVYTTGLYTA